jgi:hypothetical protein
MPANADERAAHLARTPGSGHQDDRPSVFRRARRPRAQSSPRSSAEAALAGGRALGRLGGVLRAGGVAAPSPVGRSPERRLLRDRPRPRDCDRDRCAPRRDIVSVSRASPPLPRWTRRRMGRRASTPAAGPATSPGRSRGARRRRPNRSRHPGIVTHGGPAGPGRTDVVAARPGFRGGPSRRRQGERRAQHLSGHLPRLRTRR